jgi:IS1 family transposase
VEIEKRVIWGTQEVILDIIQAERGQVIHTSYVESRNGNYRKDNERLARRSAGQSKRVNLHDARNRLSDGHLQFRR